MGSGKDRRGVSAGTVVMLTMLVLVLGGSVWVLSRLSSGNSVDLNELQMKVLSLGETSPDDSGDILIQSEGTIPAAEQSRDNTGKSPGETASAGAQAKQTEPPKKRMTLTVSGTVAIEDGIRKSAYSSDSEKYDFTDIMMLMKHLFQSDLNVAFLENVLDDGAKVSKVVVPEIAADMLREAGVNAVACGFSKAFEKGTAGISATRHALSTRNMLPFGVHEDGLPSWQMAEVQGVKFALLQYTATVASGTRKSMKKAEAEATIPDADPETIAADIAAARQAGAKAVLVFLNWGKVGGKTPTRSQKELAAQIANAGADLIIGAGSRVPQEAEYLTVEDGSRQVLCVYSTGTLLSDSRENTARLAGYLVHVTFRQDDQGQVILEDTDYTPTYAWQYKQDGKFYYRCLAADEAVPDGMDANQQKAMKRVQTYVEELLQNSPLDAAGG